MYGLIKTPLLSEKNTDLREKGTYVFKVERKSNKKQIAKAVEQLFEVKVKAVRTLVCRKRLHKSRQRLRVGKNFSKVCYWKKAFVTLAPGHKIRMFEGGG